ncbi:MAG: L-lactate dehydrogenase complex protein LldG [Candidatus Azotimanducaceae bacterium]|jgi:L-lactate dehydrogenase complex protein LldG
MSKQSIMTAIRQRLGVVAEDQTRQQTIDSRMALHAMNTRPAIGVLDGAARLDQFIYSAERKGASVSRVNNIASATEVILDILPAGSRLSLTPAATATGIKLPTELVDVWNPKTSLENSLSTCFCGIAESGSLVVRSDAGNSLTQNFLTDRHFVLLPEFDILDSMESVWARVREQGGMPRDLTLVSGPSSTGDIEMRMETGAHGPRELHILILAGGG